MKAALAAVALATLASGSWGAAQVVDLVWSPEGRFGHQATLAPQQLLEVCGTLPRGSVVNWSYDSSAPLAFNIHVHQGKDVIYPARLERTQQAQGRQVFDAEPAHCWMWTNTSTADVTVIVSLQR